MHTSDLDDNSIPGPFPTELARLDLLEVLSINNNQLCTRPPLSAPSDSVQAANWTGLPSQYDPPSVWPNIRVLSFANNGVRVPHLRFRADQSAHVVAVGVVFKGHHSHNGRAPVRFFAQTKRSN